MPNGSPTQIYPKPLVDLLNETSQDFADYFESQRRDYGQAHRLKNDVCVGSKEGIDFLGEGNLEQAQIAYMECEKSFEELGKLIIPTDKAWQLESEAGQELVEFRVVLELYPVLLSRKEFSEIKVPSFEDFGVTRQSWLAGIADATGELSKLCDELCYNGIGDEKEIYKNYIDVATELKSFLRQFARVYPLVASNNRYRGQGFGNKLRYVSLSILHRKKDLLAIRRSLSLKI